MPEEDKRAYIIKYHRKMVSEVQALDESEVSLDALGSLARELIEVSSSLRC